ncbi:hypothetical protein L1987_01797 [Smallanthus sonchifolius]|uniref:Uncharacterized protein n=1 Tax=Smallanthus sonchifolius TaxID=185202 RepID=A0ACB9K612_9ASTR|nr:hypothetical protein L1987_01797 [Smallanthus sonchifolius]
MTAGVDAVGRDSEDNVVVDHDQQQLEDSEANAGWKNDEEKDLGELVESDAVTISLEHGEIGEINVSKDTVEKQASVEAVEVNKETSKKKQDSKETEKVDLQQGLSVRQEADGNTLHQNKSEYVYDGPPFSIVLTQLESQYCADETRENEETIEGNREKIFQKMEEKRRNPIREIGQPISSKSTYKIRGVDITEAITKEEELVWEYLFEDDGMMYKLYGKKKRKLGDEEKIETVFRNNFNLEVEKFRFKTLKYDTKVFNKVIDAWVDVLNYEEKYRSPTSPYRLFCDTDLIFNRMLKDPETDWTKRMERFILNMNRAVYWNPALMDLRGIDMVFMPMLEHDHYYLIVFELKHIAISVMHTPWFVYMIMRITLRRTRDIKCVQKEIFVKYFEHVKHPKTNELNATKIKKVKIP